MTRYNYLNLKRKIEQVLMSPLILLGRLFFYIKPQKHFNLFFFSPTYGVGGAEYINAKVLASIKDKKTIAVFTKKSKDDSTLHLFKNENVEIWDISQYADNKFIYFMNFILRGYFAAWMKQSSKLEDVILFNAQCNFAYKLSAHITRKIRVVELIHLHDVKFANVWMPFIQYLDIRLCFSKIEIDKINQFSKKSGVPLQHFDKFKLLTPFVDISDELQKDERTDGILRVYYAGRGTFQKRLDLSFQIAKQIHERKLPVEFHYVGNFENELPEDFNEFARYYKPISSGEMMYNFVKSKNVILLTSSFEGFPVALLEAMHFGIIPIVTPVGEMKDAITHNHDGFLLDNSSDQMVIKSAIESIEMLVRNKTLCSNMSNSIKSTFNNKYSYKKFQSEIQSIIRSN